MRFFPHELFQSMAVPKYQSAGAAGMDLHAAHGVRVLAHWIAAVDCGVGFEIPEGYEGQIRGRSGNSRKGIWVAPGTIDCDYRGEVGAVLYNLTNADVVVEPGDRVAQIVFAPVVRVEVELVDELSETARGAQGWGSTGSGSDVGERDIAAAQALARGADLLVPCKGCPGATLHAGPSRSTWCSVCRHIVSTGRRNA